jgi:NAD(P)H-dependent flavin oxidoreductase YrpB (nitropropane dioxygenase family)
VDLLDRLKLDVPVAQAGMGGGLAGADLALAVAEAGALGTLGLAAPARLRDAIRRIHDAAPDRAVAVNLLMQFVRRSHVDECLRSRIDVAVMAFGIDKSMIERLVEGKIFVFVMVGSAQQARAAVECGASGLVAQGVESGGHLSGDIDAASLLTDVLRVAAGRPVLVAGGIATGADTDAALAAGADGVVAGTRFLLTEESGAHRLYQQRILGADNTIRTELFGMGWPAAHRVVPNAATRRWCRADGRVRPVPRSINAVSGLLAKLPDRGASAVIRVQRPALPLFTPAAPTVDMPDASVDTMALYAGQSVSRITTVISAREAVAALSPGGH